MKVLVFAPDGAIMGFIKIMLSLPSRSPSLLGTHHIMQLLREKGSGSRRPLRLDSCLWFLLWACMSSQRLVLWERNLEPLLAGYRAVRMMDREDMGGGVLSPFQGLGIDRSCLRMDLVLDRPGFEPGHAWTWVCVAVSCPGS